MIINLPKDLEKETTHRYGPNSFKLHRCFLFLFFFPFFGGARAMLGWGLHALAGWGGRVARPQPRAVIRPQLVQAAQEGRMPALGPGGRPLSMLRAGGRLPAAPAALHWWHRRSRPAQPHWLVGSLGWAAALAALCCLMPAGPAQPLQRRSGRELQRPWPLARLATPSGCPAAGRAGASLA